MTPFQTTLRLIAPLAACTLFATANLAAQGKDSILLNDGSRQQNLLIQSVTTTEMVGTDAGGELKLPFRDLRAVTFGDAPAQFALATSAERRGDFALAATLFEEALAAAGRDVQKAEYEFLALRAKAQGAETTPNEAAEVADGLAAWVAANSDFYRVPEAMLWQGRVLIAADAGEQAATVLGQLDQQAADGGWPSIWRARAKLRQGFAQLKTGDGPTSRTTFRSSLSLAQSITDSNLRNEVQDLITQATLAVGESMIAEDDLDTAKEFFERGGSNESLGLTAARQAGLGQVLFLQAGKTNDVATMRAAEMALATAITSDPAGGEISAKSLYFMGKLLLLLGDERENNVRERARGYFESITRHYGTTRWAALAREALDG